MITSLPPDFEIWKAPRGRYTLAWWGPCFQITVRAPRGTRSKKEALAWFLGLPELPTESRYD